jgi:hypothetical protein
VAVHHIGAAIGWVGPHIQRTLGIGVPPLHAGKAAAQLLALLVHALLELESLGVGRDFSRGPHPLIPVAHQQALAALLPIGREALDDVGLGELLPLATGEVTDQLRQLGVVVWRRHASQRVHRHGLQRGLVGHRLAVGAQPLGDVVARGHHGTTLELRPHRHGLSGLQHLVEPLHHRPRLGDQHLQLVVVQIPHQVEHHVRLRQLRVVTDAPWVHRNVFHLRQRCGLRAGEVLGGDLPLDRGDWPGLRR